jgi:hypothetical protein
MGTGIRTASQTIIMLSTIMMMNIATTSSSQRIEERAHGSQFARSLHPRFGRCGRFGPGDPGADLGPAIRLGMDGPDHGIGSDRGDP